MQAGEHGALPMAAANADCSTPFSGSGANHPHTEGVPDQSATEEAILRELGFGKPLIARMKQLALVNGTSLERELLASGTLREEAYYEAIARLVGLPFVSEIMPERLVGSSSLDTQLLRPTMLRMSDGRTAPVTAICPEAARLPLLTASLARMPALRDALVITTPRAIRSAVWHAGALRRGEAAVRSLFDARPEQSARIVLGGALGFYLGLGSGLLLVALLLVPETTSVWLHVLLSLTFCACNLLRLCALLHPRSKPRRREVGRAHGPLPVYTIMVGLYREAPVVPQLLAALDRLNWPRSRLDIKLVCEADDPETIAAIAALKPGSHIEVVEVPPMQPRTKPKALNYALAGARGEYLAIYDAEDRPHPDQLLEAHGRFSQAGPDLACLQAPLVISNADRSWISAIFALEYSGLFRRLLPALAQLGLPLPLGGTSNHFRTAALQSVGGWDPYNVTEDADLGLRLYRLGYRASVISRQTLEDAPTTLSVWLGQRTRWLKGWMQTWLVIMREPGSALHQMGPAGFMAFQLLIGGMLLSALLHPLLFVFVATAAISMMSSPKEDVPFADQALLAIDIGNIFGSYAAFMALGATAMIAHERRMVGWRWFAIPLYWMLVSVAGWKALIELRFRPFFWKKTPHMPHSRVSPSAGLIAKVSVLHRLGTPFRRNMLGASATPLVLQMRQRLSRRIV